MSDFIHIGPSREICRNGEHNAFTTLCKCNERLFLAFRNADGHLAFNGKILVFVSDNQGEFWTKYTELTIPGVDLRDPSLVADGDRLLLYAGTRRQNPDGTWRVDSVLFQLDSQTEATPLCLSGLPDRVFFWNAVKYGDVFYGSGYRELPPGYEAWIFRSSNGETWEKLAGPFPGNELAVDLAPGGKSIIGVLRRECPPYYPRLLRIPVDAPEQEVSRTIEIPMQGIMVKSLGTRTLIVGRTWEEPGRKNLRIKLFCLDENNELRYLQSLPSGGDCSYPSYVDIAPGRGLLVYYASHNYLDGMEKLADPEHMLPSDIYSVTVEYGAIYR